MKNKKLENYVKDKTASLNDEKFLDDLKKDAAPDKAPVLGKKSVLAICIGSIVTVALAVAIVCVALLYNPASGQDEHYYASGDENRRSSSCEELNTDTVYFDLAGDVNADVDIVFDTVSNDTLYYHAEVSLEDTFESLKLIFVTNEFYNYTFGHLDFNRHETLRAYVLDYVVTTEEEDGIYTHKVDAELITDNEKIYISYEELSLEEESNFVYCIKSLLKY